MLSRIIRFLHYCTSLSWLFMYISVELVVTEKWFYCTNPYAFIICRTSSSLIWLGCVKMSANIFWHSSLSITLLSRYWHQMFIWLVKNLRLWRNPCRLPQPQLPHLLWCFKLKKRTLFFTKNICHVMPPKKSLLDQTPSSQMVSSCVFFFIYLLLFRIG